MANEKTIFCFWEPPGSMPAYLRLCMETWKRNLGGFEIVVLNHANLESVVSSPTYDLTVLKRLDFAAQKDALLAAVLCEHGGVFMDVDTIVTRDIAPVLGKLRRTEMVLFDVHIGFAAARPGSRVPCRWTRRVQDRLVRLKQKDNSAPGFDYLGNAPLAEVMEEMAGASVVGRIYERARKREERWPSIARAVWDRLVEPIWARRKGLFFRTGYRKYLTMLDRKKYGFMAELAHYGTSGIDHIADYRRFWFEEKLEVGDVLSPKQCLIGLHNSWTPEWYKVLSEKEVLASDCLLSKTLRYVLKR